MFGLFSFASKRRPKPCVLPMQRVTINAIEVSSTGKIFHLFNRAIEFAALEYLEPQGCIPKSDSFAPQSIHLMIDLTKGAEQDWEILIQARGSGPVLSSNTIWPDDKTTAPDEAYHAMEHHLRPIIKGLARNHFVEPEGFLIARADMTSLSAHRRLQMLPTRTAILKAYTDRDKT